MPTVQTFKLPIKAIGVNSYYRVWNSRYVISPVGRAFKQLIQEEKKEHSIW